MTDLFKYSPDTNIKEINNKLIIRLINSYYTTQKGITLKKEINFLKKKSGDINWFEEDISMIWERI